MVMSYTKGIFIFGHTVYVFKEFLKISIVEKEIRKTTEECGIAVANHTCLSSSSSDSDSTSSKSSSRRLRCKLKSRTQTSNH